MTDDYELLPTDEIEYLRKEVDKLKAKPFGADTDTLIGSIRQLQSSIDALVKIFAEANDIVSDKKFQLPKQEMVPPSIDAGVLTRLEMQNEKIAKGMLGLSNMMKKQEETHAKEHQEFLKKKEIKARPLPQEPNNSGIVPSGLAPLSNQTAPEAEQRLPDLPLETSSDSPFGPESHGQITQSSGEGLPISSEPRKENTGELPEPPKPLY